jgi:Mg2+/citrate symporter
MTNKWQAALVSYLKVLAAAMIACYLAGVRDPGLIFDAGLAAILPVLYNALSENDHRYGRGS